MRAALSSGPAAHTRCSVRYCAKSLQGEAPCGSAVYGKVDEMSPAPLPPPHWPGPPWIPPLYVYVGCIRQCIKADERRFVFA